MKKAVAAGALCHRSGVPIKRVVLLRTMTDAVLIARRRWDEGLRRMTPEADPRAERAYDSQNNHHVEICQDRKTGKWSGEVVSMFNAVQRVRRDRLSAVDRSDDENSTFVMSLAEGETVFMKHPTTGVPGYFVVFKLDKPQTIHFIHHWDARPSKPRKDLDGREIEGSEREDVGGGVVASKLRDLAPPGKRFPIKVRCSPLRDAVELERD
jgi:hypothetical protein